MCVYELTSRTDWQIEIGLEVIIDKLENVEAYMLRGNSFDDLESIEELERGDILGLSVTEAAWFLVKPVNTAPLFGMNYRVKNVLSLKDFCFDYGQ